MKVKPIGHNQTELETERGSVLFSYATPVACRGAHGYCRTEVKFSNTTSKHIAQWGAKDYEAKPQQFFDDLIGEST